METAKEFLKSESNLKKLKPCVDVLKYICKKTKINIDSSDIIGITPTAIANEFYKNRFFELEKQFETATENMNMSSKEYKEIKRAFARKKKLPMQVISRKCNTLVDLKLTFENKNPGVGADKRNTYYYPLKLGLDVNNIINSKGFPIINQDKRKTSLETISDMESEQEIKKVQHYIKIREFLKQIIDEFPLVKTDGIYKAYNNTSKIEYHGEPLWVEIELQELYEDFFHNHISVNKQLAKKIATFKHQSKEFWKQKVELFEEMELDINKYFEPEINESIDIKPLDEKILDWIFFSATYLARKKKDVYNEYFTYVYLKTKIIHGDWLDRKTKNKNRLNFDIIEYSVGNHTFFRIGSNNSEDFKPKLEKKFKEYMKSLPKRRYYNGLEQSFDWLQALLAIKAEIIEILNAEIMKTHYPGKCKFIK
ncbi:MAG: hypothetical protein KAJ51_05680 [Thermoplasmata archaeon]|nr:hypothetical protein [Thermoplasmata archaeon]